MAELLDVQYHELLRENADEVAFANVIEILSGGTPKTRVVEYWKGSSIPFFGFDDVADSVYVHTCERHITKLGLNIQ